MAVYSQSQCSRAPETSWADVDFIAVTSVTANLVVILNSDGSETRLFSASGNFSQIGPVLSGNVTSMARTDASGITTYESVDGMSVPVAELIGGGGSRFEAVLMTATPLALSADFDMSASGWLPFELEAYTDTFVLADETRTAYARSTDISGMSGDTAAATSQSLALDSSVGSSLYGGMLDDLLVGDSADNMLFGGDGDDFLAGGLGGDMLVGGAGSDWADYSRATSAVVANLVDAALNQGEAAGDTYVSIENLYGSSFDDMLTGDTNDNVIRAAGGDDFVTLGGGNDWLEFHAGDGVDTVTDFMAGAGEDVIVLANFGGIASFADLLNGNHLLTVDGHAEIVLGGDRIVLQNVASHTALTSADFKF